MSANIPASLRPIGHFVKIGNEYSKRDVVVYYWCLYRAVQEGMKLDKSSPEALNYLTELLSILEEIKKSNSGVEALTQDVVAQAHIEDQAQRLFSYAESQDKAGVFNQKVVKLFYTSGYLFDTLHVFGEPDENIQSAKKYAKWRATYIHNCLKSGETPVPGNKMVANGDTNDDPSMAGLTSNFQGFNFSAGGNNPPSTQRPGDGIGFGAGSTNVSSFHQPYPQQQQPPASSYAASNNSSATGFNASSSAGRSGYNTPANVDAFGGQSTLASSSLGYSTAFQQPIPAPRGGNGAGGYSPALIANPPSPSDGAQGAGKILTTNDFTQARKLTKFALSALDYDDAKTAILNMQKALAILQQQQ